MFYIIVTISIIAVACFGVYFLNTKEEEEESFFIGCAIGSIFFAVCVVPAVILMGVIDRFNILEGNKGLPMLLPIIIFGLIVAWATHGDSKSSSKLEDKKDDFTGEAIVLAAVLSDNDSSDDSGSSNSSSSSHSSSSSSSSSDDFFIL